MYYIKCFNSEKLEMRINRFMQECTYRGLMTSVTLVIIHFHLNTLLQDHTCNPPKNKEVKIMEMSGLEGRKAREEKQNIW